MIYPLVIQVRRDSSQDILGTFAPEFGFCKVLFIRNVGLNKALYCDYEKVSLTLHKSEIKFYTLLLSLSSRRAWIEISVHLFFQDDVCLVALLAESVDRNTAGALCAQFQHPSLPFRSPQVKSLSRSERDLNSHNSCTPSIHCFLRF